MQFKKKLTEMRVDPETKTAFITNTGGDLTVFNFSDVKIPYS